MTVTRLAGWTPSTPVEELIELMVEADLARLGHHRPRLGSAREGLAANAPRGDAARVAALLTEPILDTVCHRWDPRRSSESTIPGEVRAAPGRGAGARSRLMTIRTATCDAEIVVVGAGIMGLAAAAALGRAGRSATVLEQFEFGHDRGSSHGTARIFKVSYPEPQFVRLAQESLVRWHELEDQTGDEILTMTGTLDVGGIEGRREALEECGADFEFLAAAEIERRYGLKIDGDAEGLFQPDGGVLHADRAQDALTRRAHGVEVAYETPVRELVPEDDAVLVRTADGDLRARAVVVTAGAWVTDLLAPLGLQPDVAVARETVAYFRPRPAEQGPPLSEWRPEQGQVTYGLVGRDGLLKVGVSGSGTPADPDEEGEVDEDVVRSAAAWAARRYDLLDDAPVRAETCLYTNTPDERFVVERHGRVIVGSACSGHGFKFAPAVGAQLAALALEAAVA